MVKIYMMNTGCIDLQDKKWYENLSQKRIEKLNRLKKDSAKRQSVAAEVLLNIGVEKEIKNVTQPVIWDTDESGKPYLTDYPGIHISLTHSGDYAACAVSDMPCGIDIQYMRDINLKIAERFFTKEEQSYIKASDNEKEAFYEIWVRKESFVKAVGTGITIPLDSFSVLPDTVEYKNEIYSFKMHSVPGNDYKLCTCVKNPALL